MDLLLIPPISKYGSAPPGKKLTVAAKEMGSANFIAIIWKKQKSWVENHQNVEKEIQRF